MNESDEQLIRQRATGLRIMAGALLMGSLTVAVIMIAVFYTIFDGKPAMGNAPGDLPVVTLVVTAVGLLAIFAARFVIRQTRAEAVRMSASAATQPRVTESSRAADLAATYVRAAIVGLAAAESAVIFGSVSFLMEGHWLSMILVGLGVLAMIWTFPTERAMRDWIEEQAS